MTLPSAQMRLEESREAGPFRATIAGVLAVLAIGALVGFAISVTSESEMRLPLILVALAGFVCVIAIAPRPDRLIWAMLVVSLQFLEPAVRAAYGYGGSDGIAIYFPVLLAFVALVVYTLRAQLGVGRRIRILGPLAIPILLTVGVDIVATLHGQERFRGFLHLLFLGECYLLYFLGLNAVRSTADLSRTLTLLFVALAIQSLVYYVEVAFDINYMSLLGEVIPGSAHLNRPGGTLAHNPFGFVDFVLPIIFIAIATFLPSRVQGGSHAWHRGALIVLSAVAIGLTLTRSAYMSLSIGLLYMVVFGYRLGIVSMRKLLNIAVAAAIAAAVATPLILARLEKEPTGSSYNERFALMQMAVRVIEENPWFGVGPGAYDVSFKRYLTPELADKWLWTVHNHYLLRTAETGIPGGLILLVLLFAALRQSMRLGRSREPMARALALGVGASLVAMLQMMYWDQWTHVGAHLLLWFLFGLLGSASLLEEQRRQETHSTVAAGFARRQYKR